mmetsp:Transcript_20882/g.37923  ORF Transcript_20882/g.37923 Transcript_20882/m.37923 type:complete len:92 (+) Transcript_20882:50-325(+)
MYVSIYQKCYIIYALEGSALVSTGPIDDTMSAPAPPNKSANIVHTDDHPAAGTSLEHVAKMGALSRNPNPSKKLIHTALCSPNSFPIMAGN